MDPMQCLKLFCGLKSLVPHQVKLTNEAAACKWHFALLQNQAHQQRWGETFASLGEVVHCWLLSFCDIAIMLIQLEVKGL